MAVRLRLDSAPVMLRSSGAPEEPGSQPAASNHHNFRVGKARQPHVATVRCVRTSEHW